MKRGEAWAIDFLDHCEQGSGTTGAWSKANPNPEPVLMRAVGVVVGIAPKAISMAVNFNGDESTAEFIIVRSAIVAQHKIKLPRLRRKPRACAA